MSRILLIKCSQYEGYASVFTFPLGIMYLASTLRQASDNHEIKIYDLRMQGQDYSLLKEATAVFKPDIVGISAITMEAPSLERAARTVRETGFDGPLVAGGPHPTAYPEETLAFLDIDYLVLGEGETTFKELVETLNSGKDPKSVAGIAYREDGQVVCSAPRPPLQNLDSIPHPAWDLVDIGDYERFRSMDGLRRERYMNLFTSRSCPYRCVYCHSLFGKGFQARSPENVLEEVKLLADRYDIRYFEIVDDIFNCDLKRANKIFDLLHAEGLRISLTFPNGLRCDNLDEHFLESLSRFKFSAISVPVESASPRIQKMIRKNLNLSKVSQMIGRCADLRIYTRGFFMLGFPTETREELEATVDYAVKSKLHTALFFVVVPFKGTELYEMCREVIEERGYKHEDHDYFKSPLNVSAVEDDVLFKIQRWAYLRMASRPSRIYRLFRDFPDYRFIWIGLKTWAGHFLGAGKGLRPGKPPQVPGARKPRKPA